MPRPARNSINMHDIIAQPLGAITGAVNAILHRQVDLDDAEVESIFDEAPFLLLRAKEAMAACDADAFCALFKLLLEGFSHSEIFLIKGVETFSTQHTLLQTLSEIFTEAVTHRRFPLQSEAVGELLRVIGSLCDGSIRNVCAALFMEGLASVLSDMYRENLEEARACFQTQRAAAASLIQLVKGSKQNKQRILSWEFLAKCCALSVDFFFQLQCVELFFRVSWHNQALLTNLGTHLHPTVIERIRQLPNDSTLITKMAEVVASINNGREDVLIFPLTSTDVASAKVTGDTVSCFTEKYFVVIVMSDNADNITIPYDTIRSVMLRKNGRVTFRLNEFPSKLELLLTRAPGEDTVSLVMDPERLDAFKASSIRSWIVATLDSRRGQRQKSGDENINSDRKSGSTALLFSRERQDTSSEKKHRAESVSLVEGNKTTDFGSRQVAPAFNEETGTDKLHESAAAGVLGNDGNINKRTAALSATMVNIQHLVDGGRCIINDHREAFRHGAEKNIQNIESCLQASQEKATLMVERLNDALQKLKDGNAAIHDQLACIEIQLQVTLEESREKEAKRYDLLRAEGEERIEQLEHMLDSQLMRRSSPLKAISRFLQTDVK
uniref:PH-like domain-containing protein n=1 Tax=Trypanosoma vivax (strain Y486) TaxID=1055687 RepID=G0TSQ2_TRYVY|nr:conserved hypothetical protein [Trypanosoma vivax Y486]